MADDEHGHSGTNPGGENRPGEGFGSRRPGNEYGAGARGYAGAPHASESGGSFGAGGDDPYRAGAGYRDAARDALGGAAPRLLDDLARFVTDAAGAAQGVRREVETALRSQAESALSRMDVVRRDEFEVVREMVVRLRAENDALKGRVEALEAKLGTSE